jgi:hypothetical protein
MKNLGPSPHLQAAMRPASHLRFKDDPVFRKLFAWTDMEIDGTPNQSRSAHRAPRAGETRPTIFINERTVRSRQSAGLFSSSTATMSMMSNGFNLR